MPGRSHAIPQLVTISARLVRACLFALWQKAKCRGARCLWEGGRTMHEKRSGTHAGVQLDWVNEAGGQGVGARHGAELPPPGGGGYLDECTPAQLWTEAKFRELADMGLPKIWLDVAFDLGYDAFMRMWRRLDAAIELRSEADSMIEIQLRRYASFQRYQRNRFIESLVDLGLPNREIRERVALEVGEHLSATHIRRMAAQRRSRVRA